MRFGFRELLFVLVLLSVPLASFMFVFKPRNNEIQQAKKEVEIKTAKLEQLREVSARMEDIGKAIAEWDEALRDIEGKLPSEQGIDEILQEVWNLTKANGLNIKSTKAEAAVPAAAYMELPLKIEMSGNFDGFYQFLLELEQMPRITRVHNMVINKAGTGKRRSSRPSNDQTPVAEGAMEAAFTLSIYYESSRR
ncbi:MAG: type 4a pilus biogenesis protein PilO [Phycisphaerales bacterium]